MASSLTFTSFMIVSLLFGTASAQLSSTFYSSSCPNALSIIKSAVDSAVNSDSRMGASLLRLHFHDCWVNGCDASVLLADTSNFTGEQSAPTNSGSLRGFNVVDTIKSNLESSCPGIVSCADILAVAARDSVVKLGGTGWTVVLGRRDSTTASLSATNSNIPGPGSSLSSLISNFANKGFSAKEMVTLSGSHTIGRARCQNFRNRLYNEANLNATLATSLKTVCPTSGQNNALAALNNATPDVFDNRYYTDLIIQKGLLHSDQVLFNGGSTDAQVRAYATNQATFLTDFANAMVKMGNLSPLTGTSGQIRRNCNRRN